MRRLVALVWLAAAVSAGAQQQASPVGDPAVAGELARMNATLREIADTLAKQAEQSSLDLLMKRTQMAQALMERAEAQLERATNDRTAIDDEMSRLIARRKGMQAAPEAERDAATAEIDAALKRLGARLRAIDAEIIEVQNRIVSRQDELHAWQTVLDRRLGGQ